MFAFINDVIYKIVKTNPAVGDVVMVPVHNYERREAVKQLEECGVIVPHEYSIHIESNRPAPWFTVNTVFTVEDLDTGNIVEEFSMCCAEGDETSMYRRLRELYPQSC